MLYTKTSNYDKFICIADRCPASCCKGWEIVIDEEKIKEYSEYQGPIAGRLFNGINWEEGTFKQFNGRCAMLGDNEYCDLQLEAGEGMLCNTCRLYPRHIEEFEDVRELSLSLSCPEAARIILENTESINLLNWETDEEDDYDEYEDFDYLLYTQLVDARKKCLEIVQDRSLRFVDKVKILITYGYELQQCINTNEVYKMEEISPDIVVAPLNDELTNDNIPNIMEKRWFSKLFELETLNDNWKKTIDCAWKNWIPKEEFSHEEEVQAEQLLFFWIYTYFCGAVYDDLLFSKLMLAVCSTFWIFQINATNNFEGGIIQVAYSYAREIEHSDDNLVALDEWFDVV